MAYLNRDPGMCRFEPDPARGRNDLVAGSEAALRLLARQGRREPHCFRDLSYAKPPPESWRLADAREACDAVASELEREIAAETIRLAARRGGGRAGGPAHGDGRRQDDLGRVGLGGTRTRRGERRR